MNQWTGAESRSVILADRAFSIGIVLVAVLWLLATGLAMAFPGPG